MSDRGCMLDRREGGQREKLNAQLAFNQRRAAAEDHTDEIDLLTDEFDYAKCRDTYWNPEPFSLLWGTRVWDESTNDQRRALNHLFWVAYYAQIVSAEIATIFFNQIAAAGLYGVEDFRTVCDTLDLESRQERAHIHAFRTVGRKVEDALLGAPLFTYAMRGPFAETMVFSANGKAASWWRSLQMRAYSLIAPSSPTLAAYYLLIRGLRTLNGKLVQERLAAFTENFDQAEDAPIPARISLAHFADESFHFNTSRIVALEVPKILPKPSLFERWAINRAVEGTQRDHMPASAAINGIFWHDPALYPGGLQAVPVAHLRHGRGRGPAHAASLLRRGKRGSCRKHQDPPAGGGELPRLCRRRAGSQCQQPQHGADGTHDRRAPARNQPACPEALPPGGGRLMTFHTIKFPGSIFDPVFVPAGAPLSQHLTPENSPVLFGCRAGLCGTCAAKVRVIAGDLPEADESEREALDVYAPGELGARLLCQTHLTADIAVERLE